MNLTKNVQRGEIMEEKNRSDENPFTQLGKDILISPAYATMRLHQRQEKRRGSPGDKSNKFLNLVDKAYPALAGATLSFGLTLVAIDTYEHFQSKTSTYENKGVEITTGTTHEMNSITRGVGFVNPLLAVGYHIATREPATTTSIKGNLESSLEKRLTTHIGNEEVTHHTQSNQTIPYTCEKVDNEWSVYVRNSPFGIEENLEEYCKGILAKRLKKN